MVDCSNKNIHIFFKYVKGELTRKEEYSIDRHLQNCEDCLLNFAYVEEIYTKKHLLSSDEKTLFIKCLSDPIWNSEIDKIKKGFRQELKEEIESLSNIKNKSIDKSDNKNDIPKSDVVLTSIALQATDSNIVSFNRESSSYKRYSSFSRMNKYLVAAASIVIFAGLSTSVYLMINKSTSQSQSLSIATPSFSSPSTNNNTNNSLDSIYNKITNNKPTTNNLYQDLDLAIDEYLEHQQISSINKAKNIATEIDNKYGDKYGVDLVKYYTSSSRANHSKLLEYRRELNNLVTALSGDDYQEHLKKANKLEEQFILLENEIEAYKVKVLMTKLCVMSFNDLGYKQLIGEAIPYVSKKNYVFLKLQFSLWQAKYYSNTRNYLEVEEKLVEVIALSKQLENHETQASASMTLAGLYHINNKDKEALELAQSAVILNNSRQDVVVSLLHISGLSAFKLKLEKLSEQYFQQAINLSQTNNNHFLLALSYTFLATTLSEKGDFTSAEEYFAKALNTSSEISDYITKLDLLARIDGYSAKSKLAQGEYQTARALYFITLSRLEKLGAQASKLEISQINQGLAIALDKVGDRTSDKYQAIATQYFQQAQVKNEKQNCLLSFLPVRCN